MKVTSKAIVNGHFEDRFGKRGTDISKYGAASRSIPLSISDYPAETKTFALFLEDKDSIPVCGFAWIHWLAANIKRHTIEENESVTANDFIQGVNSLYNGLNNPPDGPQRLEVSNYVGMAPPDRPHEYELHVFALDTDLDLEQGFYWNELYHAMNGHILAQTTISAIYDS